MPRSGYFNGHEVWNDAGSVGRSGTDFLTAEVDAMSDLDGK